MKLNMFSILSEEDVTNEKADMDARIKELAALNNPAKELIKKVAEEFNKDYDDIKKYLLPLDLKKHVSKTEDELNNIKESVIKELKRKYYDIAPKGDMSNNKFIRKLMKNYIERSY
jgi:uncharacterized protein Yka (UPF0111/DUF47 family)